MPMPITIVNNNNQQLLCALYCTCLIDCQFLFLRGGGVVVWLQWKFASQDDAGTLDTEQ